LIILGFYYFTYKHGGKDLSRYLVEIGLGEGLDVNTKDNHGEIPLHLVSGEKVAGLLIDLGSNINVQNNAGNTPLHFMAEKGRLNIAAILIDRGAKLDIRNMEGFTPLEVFKRTFKASDLHWWAGIGNIEAVIALGGKQKLDLNQKDKEGNSPLHYAAFYRKIECSGILKELGTDLSLKNNEGQTAIDVYNKKYASTELHWWTELDDLKKVSSLVLENKVNINAQDSDGRTPLQIAAIHGNKEILKFLLLQGADPKIADKEGKNAYSYAKENYNDESLRILYCKGDCK